VRPWEIAKNDLGEGNAHEWIGANNDNDDAFRVLRGLWFVLTTGELVGPLNLRGLRTYLKCLSQFAELRGWCSAIVRRLRHPRIRCQNPKYVMLSAEQLGAVV